MPGAGSPQLDQRRRLQVGLHAGAGAVDSVVVAAKPRLELVPVVRAAGHAGATDILHGQKRVRCREVHDDAIFRARAGTVGRPFAAGIADRVRPAVHRFRPDIERRRIGSIRERMPPMWDMYPSPLPSGPARPKSIGERRDALSRRGNNSGGNAGREIVGHRALNHAGGQPGLLLHDVDQMMIDRGLEFSLEAILAFETEALVQTSMTKDNLEGTNAFFEKREPKFTGD